MDQDNNQIEPSNGNNQALSNYSASLAETIFRFKLRYRAEMGDLELADWLETLSLYPLPEVQQAMNLLMRNPPKQRLPDGTLQDWTGMPSLVDVTRTIEHMREFGAVDRRKEETEHRLAELRELEKRRKAGEKFYCLADLAEDFNKLVQSKAPPTDGQRHAELEKQKEKLEKERR